MVRRIMFLLVINLVALTMFYSVAAQDQIEIVVFRDQDSLTVYIPGTRPVSLRNVGLEVTVNDQRNLYLLQDYASFGALHFDNIPTPICFRLERVDSDSPIVQDCRGKVMLTQQLADADVFWYDQNLNENHTVLVVSAASIGICPAGEARCEMEVTPPESPPTTEEPSSSSSDTGNSNTQTGSTGPESVNEPEPPIYFPIGSSNDSWTPETRDFNGVEMVRVPAGCFIMGSEDGRSNEYPITEVCIEEAFWIDRFEVTNAQFSRFNGQAGTSSSYADANRPRDKVTWFEAKRFCESRDARLPTEAEWEYVARGPESWIFAWGNSFSAQKVVYVDNSDFHPANVGSKSAGASWVGAMDMTGNLWEWTSSIGWGYPYREGDGRENDSDTSSQRIVRGGCFDNPELWLRAAARIELEPSYQDQFLGFRCARSD